MITKESSLNSIGRFTTQSTMNDGEGIRITNDFFDSLIKETSKNISKYINQLNEVPFVFKEKQLHTVFAPAFDRVSDVFLMESPVNREWSNTNSNKSTDSHGWVDYWCKYRDISYFIEVKHDFLSCKTRTPNKITKENWSVALDQLEAIEKEVQDSCKHTKGSFKVVLHVIPLWEKAADYNHVSKISSEIIKKIQKNAMDDIHEDKKHKSNWSCLWELHDELKGPYQYTDKSKEENEYYHECYPGLLFLLNISEITKDVGK